MAAAQTISHSNSIDMTSGAPARIILRFGLPLIAANTLQQMYAMVDTVVLGRFNGVSGLAALGTCSWPIWLSVSILTNFSQAASILLSKRFGAGETEKMKQAMGNVYTVAGLLYLVMMILSQLLARPLLIWQNTPPEVLESAVLYLRISYGGIFALFAYNIFAAFLRAVGDSKTPLCAIVAATAINILLDLWFVGSLGWGIAGVAVATVIAQIVSASVCMVRVFGMELFRLRKKHFKADLPILREYMALSVPMLLQSFVIAAGGFFVQNHINGYGSVFAAGMSATNKVFGLLETGAIALAQSTATFVGQNYGANRFDRIRDGVRCSLRISLAIATLLVCAMFFGGRPLLSLYVAPKAIDTAWDLLRVMSVGLWIMYPMYVLRQSLQALGNAMIPLVAALVQLLTRILVTLYLPLALGQSGLYFPTIIAWMTSLVMIGFVFPRQLRFREADALPLEQPEGGREKL